MHDSKCIRCDTCDGFPCLVHAKADAEVLCVEPALKYPNVTLLTEAYVKRLETSPSGGEVTKVHCGTGRRERRVFRRYRGGPPAARSTRPRCCFAPPTTSIPNGLANGSDVVGRHYMGHVNSVIMAISKCANPTVFQKTLSFNDFYFGSTDWKYPMGHISFVGKLDAETLDGRRADNHARIHARIMAKHSLDFWLTSEDLPDPKTE